jgi:hypothetical protein
MSLYSINFLILKIIFLFNYTIIKHIRIFLYETFFLKKEKKFMIGSWDRDSKSRLLITNGGISFFLVLRVKKKKALITRGKLLLKNN